MNRLDDSIMQLAMDDLTQDVVEPFNKLWLKTALISNMDSWIASHLRSNNKPRMFDSRSQITAFVDKAYSA